MYIYFVVVLKRGEELLLRFMFLFIGKAELQREGTAFYLPVQSPNGHERYARFKPGFQSSFWVSNAVEKVLSQLHSQGAGLDVEWLGLEPACERETGIRDGSFTHCATMLPCSIPAW